VQAFAVLQTRLQAARSAAAVQISVLPANSCGSSSGVFRPAATLCSSTRENSPSSNSDQLYRDEWPITALWHSPSTPQKSPMYVSQSLC